MPMARTEKERVGAGVFQTFDLKRSDTRGGVERLTNYRGEVLDLDGREIVASNGRLHAAMVGLTGEDGGGGG